ncbi:hypothetical protein PLICRDRAFT_182700 [Plicaturopsis crispa FD-325 SS-3]|nr:hypothetical protein PLICRDRAFT_182700 [Plicaturopsis crispa FD-325 SS-3]
MTIACTCEPVRLLYTHRHIHPIPPHLVILPKQLCRRPSTCVFTAPPSYSATPAPPPRSLSPYRSPRPRSYASGARSALRASCLSAASDLCPPRQRAGQGPLFGGAASSPCCTDPWVLAGARWGPRLCVFALLKPKPFFTELGVRRW